MILYRRVLVQLVTIDNEIKKMEASPWESVDVYPVCSDEYLSIHLEHIMSRNSKKYKLTKSAIEFKGE